MPKNELIYVTLRDEGEMDSYSFDVECIQRAAASEGYAISAKDAQAAWERYSESMAAGWMMLEDTPAETWSRISHYFAR